MQEIGRLFYCAVGFLLDLKTSQKVLSIDICQGTRDYPSRHKIYE